MNRAELKQGMIIAVNVPDQLPDPTDPAFGMMKDGVLEVGEVHDGYFHYNIISGTLYSQKGSGGSIPFKYLPYCTPRSSGPAGDRKVVFED